MGLSLTPLTHVSASPLFDPGQSALRPLALVLDDKPLVLWHLVLYPVPVGPGQVRPKYRAQGQRVQGRRTKGTGQVPPRLS